MDPLKDELRKRLERDLVRDVGLTLYVDEAQTSREVVRILEDIASLSDKIKLDVVKSNGQTAEDIPRLPALKFTDNIVFYGIPAKYEYQAVVEGIIIASSGNTHIDESLIDDVQAASGDLTLFVTPSCPACPAATELLYGLAAENPQIRVEIVSLEEFPELAEEYRVMGVPTVVAEGGRINAQVPDEVQVLSLLDS